MYCFEQGNYIESAMYFAKTKTSFEEIALKFMQVEEKTALLNFLKKRLEQVIICFSPKAKEISRAKFYFRLVKITRVGLRLFIFQVRGIQPKHF